MLTDDPGTPGDGVWEINLSYQDQRTRQNRSRSFPHIDFNFGVGENVQLKYETGWAFVDATDGGGTRSGLDDSLLGLKWRFLDQASRGIDVSVYPQIQVENGTGSVSRGIAEPGPNLFLPLQAGFAFGKTKWVGEIGYQTLRAQRNEWVVGVLGARQLTDTLELMAEVHSVSQNFQNRGDLVVNAGLRQSISDRFRLLASVGTGLSSGPEVTSLIAYLGIQVVLGEEKSR